jgi:predicted esterase
MIAESTAHAAREYLKNAGYSPEFHVYDMGHEISGEVIRDLVAWMNNVLPPLGAAD